MKRESEDGVAKRAQYMARVMEILAQKHVIEAGRLIVIDQAYRARTIYQVLGYDFAVFRVEFTGCAFGHRGPEIHGEVYRSSAGGQEEFLLLSDIRAIEPFLGSLPTMEESAKKRDSFLSLVCQARLPKDHPCYETSHCCVPNGHVGYLDTAGHAMGPLPIGVRWPKEAMKPRKSKGTL